jgi:hypothetical protein
MTTEPTPGDENATADLHVARSGGPAVDQATPVEAVAIVNHHRIVKEVNITTQAGIEQKEAGLLTQFVSDAYQMLPSDARCGA